MINELMLGAHGYCPTTDLSDIYSQAFDLWIAGKRTQAFDMFGRVLCFNSVVQTAGAPQKYVLVARGVFRNTRSRRASAGDASAGRGGAQGAGGRAPRPFDAAGEKTVKEALDLLKPYLKA